MCAKQAQHTLGLSVGGVKGAARCEAPWAAAGAGARATKNKS